jgi:hypothetical protein
MILFIILVENVMKTDKCYNKNETLFRRNHIAEAVGAHMLVFGGTTDKGQFLNDVYNLNMDTLRWLKIPTKGSRPPPIASMCSALVIQPERLQGEVLQIYKLPEVNTKSFYKKLKAEGVYIFGGITKEREVLNDLRVLRLGKKPLDWVKPNAHGKRPAPRYSATLNYLQDLAILVLHGGKDDSHQDLIYNDTFIFDLYTFTWIEVKLYNAHPYPRCEHRSVVFGSKWYYVSVLVVLRLCVSGITSLC